MISIIFDVTKRSIDAPLFHIFRCNIDEQRMRCPSIVTIVIDLSIEAL